MTIRSYDENGKTFFEVYVHIRSNVNRKYRAQKRIKAISSMSKAQSIEKQLIQECALEVERLEGRGLNWGELVELWVKFKENDEYDPISQPVLTDYYRALKAWTSDVWNKPAKELSRADIRKLINHLEQEELSKSFQSKMKHIINRVFLWGVEEARLPGTLQSPTIGIKVNRKKERVPTILNKEEIILLLEKARFYEHRWYPIWAMAVLTGCRNGELFAMTWSDVDFESMSIRISKSYNKRMNITKSTKAGYWRNIPINQEMKELLLDLKNNSKDQFVLPHFREWRHGYQAKVLRAFCQSIGITPIRFHDLRACFATQLLQHQVAPATVMKICGWCDLDTMGRYIRLAGIDESGATDNLKFLTPKEAYENIRSILNTDNKKIANSAQ